MFDSYFRKRLNLTVTLSLLDFSDPRKVCSEVMDPFIANQFY